MEQPRGLCALGGQQTAAAIERTIPILHAGPGCGFKLHLGLGMFNGFQGGGYSGGSGMVASNLGEGDVVFGGEERLRSVIEGALEIMDGDLYVVLTGCSSELIGDDVAAIVSSFRSRGVPIVYAKTGGFLGNNHIGHEIVAHAIIDQLLTPAPERIPNLVNVWSSVPYQDTFWSGNLAALRQLLAGLGMDANILFGPNSGGLASWRRIPAAQFNLVVSPWVGASTATKLEQRFGTPWLHYPALPMGGVETSQFLRTVARFAGIDRGRTERFVRQQEAEYYYYVDRSADFIMEFRWDLPSRFTTIADSLYVAGIARFLTSDYGLIPSVQFATDEPPQPFRETIAGACREILPGISAEVRFASDGGAIREALRGLSGPPPILLGSSWDRELARELGACHLSLAAPMTDRIVCSSAYAGYHGGLRLIEDLYSSILGSVQ